MDKTVDLKDSSTVALEKRKADLLSSLRIPSNILRATPVRQYLTCCKKNCRCQRGHKHGPFYYLVQSLQVGKTRKFLLKSVDQKEQAQVGTAAYTTFQRKVEELSQINTELLRRGMLLSS